MRRVAVLAILLAGCSSSTKSSKPSHADANRSKFVSTWRPEPDPAPKPPRPPAPPPPPAPLDPAAEQLRLEAALRRDEANRRRENEREFAGLPSLTQRRIVLVGDGLKIKGLDHLPSADLAVIKQYPRQFPQVSPADLEQALAAHGDRKGAPELLANLGITDVGTALRVRVAFGEASEATCNDARAAAAEIARVGLAGLSDRARSTVNGRPDLFPARSNVGSKKEKTR